MKAARGEAEDRWQARPGLAGVVRFVAFILPIAMSTAFAIVVSALLPPASSRVVQVVVFALVSVAATGVLIVVDHAARRLLPLAALFNLSIVFPDQAPSRYKIARRAAGVRSLRSRIEAAERAGVRDEPAKAAEIILELVTALQRHDRRTRGHSERVHLFTEMLAQELKLSESDRDRLRWAALVHDVGKLTVSEDILNKSGTPDTDEWEALQRHPFEGSRLCAGLREWMGPWWLAIEQHHEHYDGGGYPRGLAGKDISLGARIVSVADSFEVMTAARSYKHASSAAAAREELARCAGTQFDPDIVRAFLNISLGRMRLAMGPLAWLAQFPFLDGAIRAGNLLRLAGGMLMAGTTAVLVGAPTFAADPTLSDDGVAGHTETVATAPDSSDEAPTSASRPFDLTSAFPIGTSVPRAEAPTGEPALDPVIDTGPVTFVPEVEGVPPPAFPEPLDAPAPPLDTPTPDPVSPPTPPPLPTPPPVPTPPPLPTPPVIPPAPLPNTAPIAVLDVAITNEDVAVVVDVRANDIDADGDPLTVVRVDDPAAGSAVDNGNGTITYTPDPDRNGFHSFSYDISDGSQTDTATVSVTVIAVNDAPSFTAGPNQTTAEDAGPQVVAAWASGMSPGPADEAGQVLTFAATPDDPSLFAAGPAIDATTGTLTYTPAPNASGTTAIAVTLSDSGGTANGGVDTSPAASFDLTITAANDDPVAVDDVVTVNEDSSVTFNVLTNDADPDGDALSIQSFNASGITDGTLVDDGGGQFTFTPDPDFEGLQQFTYVVADPSAATATATVRLTVLPQPDDPVAVDDSYVAQTNTLLTVNVPGVLANDDDADDDLLVVTLDSAPAEGVLVLNVDGSFTYLAGLNPGTFTFGYTVTDPSGRTASATATITVGGAVSSTTFWFGTSGVDATTYDLLTTPAAAAVPVPDHDGDGDVGLTIDEGGKDDETDPDKYHDWTRTFGTPTTFDGQVTLTLWSTTEAFDTDDKGHYDVRVHDCASDGTDCNEILASDSHIDPWNAGVADWVEKELSMGSITHTFLPNRMLRVRLMFRHTNMWVAMTDARPTRITLSD